ncbi:MAG: hypothetical protein KIPDCIKN_01813 [Haliscomenobacter sp.]|jgi:hypothetical protein|nr:hypothetical protein [Haliscomenobacter sp.]
MEERNIYSRIVELWVLHKQMYPESNPSAFIIHDLTGQTYSGSEPKTAVEVMEVIGKIKGFAPLSEQERNLIAIEASRKIPGLSPNNKGISPLAAVGIMTGLKWLGNGLGWFSILYSGWSWWVIGFIIAFWWAGGAARMAAQKQQIEPGPSWEMPAHTIIHIATFIGLISTSIRHIL